MALLLLWKGFIGLCIRKSIHLFSFQVVGSYLLLLPFVRKFIRTLLTLIGRFLINALLLILFLLFHVIADYQL